jgi:hypothetical protein
VLYLANPNVSAVRDAMRAGMLGAICAPGGGRRPPAGVPWCADNGCFGVGWPGYARWLAWLDAFPTEQRASCLFATAPDVVADAAATLTRSLPYLPQIRELGYPAGFVAQDGSESLPFPWDDLDAVFIGGSTRFKLGPHAIAIAAEAKRRGKWVHVGRVNSARRMRFAAAPAPYGLGADSADGTYLAFGPDTNLPNVLAWVRGTDHPTLFGGIS